MKNKSDILKIVLENENVSRKELVQAIPGCKSQINQQVRELLDCGLIQESPQENTNGAGRPMRLLSLSPRAILTCGIYLGRPDIHMCICDGSFTILDQVRAKNPFIGNDSRCANTLFMELWNSLMDKPTVKNNGIFAAGISVPGIIDVHHNKIIKTSLSGLWTQPDMANDLSQQTGGIPFFLENGLKAVAFYENKRGQGRGIENMISVGFNGCMGIITNGKILYGSGYRSGETGAYCIDENGPVSSYGIKGTLSSYFSFSVFLSNLQSVIIDESNAHIKNIKTEEEFITAFANRDPMIGKIVEHGIKHLGTALRNLMTYIPVELIVLDKWLGAFPRYSVDILNYELAQYHLADCGPPLKAVVSCFGDEKFAVGAAFQALYRSFQAKRKSSNLKRLLDIE